MRTTVRGYFIALTVAVLAPALALTAGLLWWSVGTQREHLERVLRDDAETLSQALDREMRVAIAALETLRHSDALQRGDMTGFAEAARRVHADHPHWLTIVLTRSDGQQVMNLAAEPGQSLPNISNSEVIQGALKGRPSISELIVGRVVNVHLVGIHVPVVINSEIRYALGLSLPAAHFQHLLEAYPAAVGAITGIVDQKGIIVARSLEPEKGIGTPTAPMWMAARQSERGIVRGTGRLNIPVVGAYARSDLSRWMTIVSVPASQFNEPRDQALLAVIAGGGTLLGSGLLIAFYLGHRVVRPIEQLARAAEGYVRGDVGKVPAPSSVIEVNHLTEAFVQAGQLQRETATSHQQSEQRFELLVQGVSDYAIIMLDPTGHVSNWNTGAERIKGYRADEIIGVHFSRFYTDEDRQRGMPERALETALSEGRYESEGWRVRKDGSLFFASVLINRIRDPAGRLIGFAHIVRDVTEKREAAKRLEQAREQLFQSQKMEAVGHLTGGVAHDFNNLLTIIIGNLDASKRTIGDWKEGAHARLARYIDSAMQGARRAAVLTSHLLAFSRRQPLDPKVLDVNKLLQQLEQFLKSSLGEIIHIETIGGGGIWPIDVDQVRLESAILNLAVNARDAMPGGGKLTIETSNVFLDEDYCRRHADVKSGQYVLISVSDTGEGMTRETAERAFEPFFTTKDRHGTGLGLSQVYGFVKQSGGHIEIHSERGQGTTVNLYLPRAHAKLSEDDGKAPPLSVLGNETILVVEDDEDVRAFIAETLMELNYTIIQAQDADSALRALDRHAIDLLLTDVVLPGMNGKELALQALARNSKLKVLFMTGYSRNAVVHHGRLDAGVELIQKPLTQASLSDKVRRVLDRARSP